MRPLSTVQSRSLLARIDVDASPDPDHAGLALLQRSFLHHVPFENLDIVFGRRIVLDDDAIFDKVVTAGRGGYCYELNSLFARLLEALGYSVRLVSARVYGDDGPSPEFDHLTLVVSSASMPTPTLADVGFGDAFVDPIPLDELERRDGIKRVRVARHDERWRYLEDRGDGPRVQYDFSDEPRSLADFIERNDWQQESPDSHFTKGSVCTRLTDDGRVTLSGPGLGDRLITTNWATGERRERRISVEEVPSVLADHFGILGLARGSAGGGASSMT